MPHTHRRSISRDSGFYSYNDSSTHQEKRRMKKKSSICSSSSRPCSERFSKKMVGKTKNVHRNTRTDTNSDKYCSDFDDMDRLLLDRVDEEIFRVECVLEEEAAFLDERIRRNPWERLYVLNNAMFNKRHNDAYQEYCALLSMRQDIISGKVKHDLMKKEQEKVRVNGLYGPSGVFNRLYNKRRIFVKRDSERENEKKKVGSTNLKKKISKGGSNVPSFNIPFNDDVSGSELNCYERLYAKGIASIKRKQKQTSVEHVQRERKDLTEYALGRITARLHADDYYESVGKKKCKNAQDAKKKALEEQINQVENLTDAELKKLLRTNTLTREEEEKKFSILYKRGYIPKNVLEERKKEIETAHCTFHPKINAYPSTQERNLLEESRLFQERKKNKEMDLIRNRKSEILKAKMEADHHFRRRVELDPSIGERFMNHLVVR